MRYRGPATCVLCLTFAASAVAGTPPADSAKPVKVFILAGQSNMEGKAKLALLDHQIAAPETTALFAHLHVDGAYVVGRRSAVPRMEGAHGGVEPGRRRPPLSLSRERDLVQPHGRVVRRGHAHAAS